MNQAYLTIDDGPTIHTRGIIDYLKKKNITPILFFCGTSVKLAREDGIYAIRQGSIVGNHSYTHPGFSQLSYEECIEEIELQEKEVNALYEEAGVERKYKLFRFPYGDKGGDNKERLQEYLQLNGFCRIDDSKVNYPWYAEQGLNKDYDVLWTYDFGEYQLGPESDFIFDDIINNIHNESPTHRGPMLGNNIFNIILIHDHLATEEFHPGYFKELIDYITERGVEFVTPSFLQC